MESLAFSMTSPPLGVAPPVDVTGSLPEAGFFEGFVTGSFAEPALLVSRSSVALAFALDVAREDGFFLLLAM